MGPYLSQPETEKHSVKGEGQTLWYAGTQMQGWRNTMEDAQITKPDIGDGNSLFAVFDGHGGKEVAIFAANHFQDELMSNINYKKGQFDQALIETFKKIDDMLVTPIGMNELNQIRGSSDEAMQAGCTANVALILKGTLYVANAGDSRSVLCRNNQPFDMSVDHKPDCEQEKKRIERACGFVSDVRTDGNLYLSRALGDLEYKKDKSLRYDEQIIICKPEVKTTLIGQQDKLLLMGCDGIFESLDHKELMDFINQSLGNSPITPELLQKTAENLLDKLLAPDISQGTGCDNMTCLLVYFKH